MDDSRVAALALLGMPLRPDDLALPPMPHPSELRGLKRPVLVLTGDNDTHCPPEDASRFTNDLPDGRLHILEGADHYLWRREREAAAIVGAFVDDVLGVSP